MSHFNKFVSFIFGCVLVIMGIVYLLDGLFHFHLAASFVDFLVSHGLIVGIVFILAGGFVIALNCLLKPSKTVKVPGNDAEKPVHVSLSAIENMVKKTAVEVPGVRHVGTSIKNSRNGLLLNIKIRMEYGDKMNAVTKKLQDDIKTLIESDTSVPVHSVRVTVVKATGEKDVADYRGKSMMNDADSVSERNHRE